jgi:hypothetical protein
LRLPPDAIAATASRREEIGRTPKQPGRTSFTICSTRDSHTDAALPMMSSFFRFPSVASKPCFSHDPVNLAPDCNGYSSGSE